MVTPDLIAYIEEQQKKNISKEIISAGLLKAGWEAQDIEEGFSKIKVPTQVQTSAVQAKPASFDPYRESPVETPKVSVPVFSPAVKKSEPAKVWPEVKMSPTAVAPVVAQTAPVLKTKEDIIVPVTPKIQKPIQPVMQNTVASSFEKSEDLADVSDDKSSGSPKLVIWTSVILIIVVLVIAIGGIALAFMKGYIKMPEFGTTQYKQQIASQIKQIESLTNDLNAQKLATANSNSDLLVSKDQNIRFAVASIIPATKAFYTANGKSYGKISNTDGNCLTSTQGSLFAQVSPINTDVNIAINTLLPFVKNVASCYSTKTAWAVAAPLASDPTTFFCADSSGFLKETKTPLTDTACK